MEKDRVITAISIFLMIVGILLITLWAIGKSLGWIHSPDWVEMIPFFGAVVTLTGISISIGRVLQKLDRVITDVEKATNRTDNLSSRMIAAETRIEFLDK